MKELTVQQLIDELIKARYKDIPVRCLAMGIDCGYVIKVYQGDTSLVLKLELPEQV